METEEQTPVMAIYDALIREDGNGGFICALCHTDTVQGTIGWGDTEETITHGRMCKYEVVRDAVFEIMRVLSETYAVLKVERKRCEEMRSAVEAATSACSFIPGDDDTIPGYLCDAVDAYTALHTLTPKVTAPV